MAKYGMPEGADHEEEDEEGEGEGEGMGVGDWGQVTCCALLTGAVLPARTLALGKWRRCLLARPSLPNPIFWCAPFSPGVQMAGMEAHRHGQGAR